MFSVVLPLLYVLATLHEGSSTTYFVKPSNGHSSNMNMHTLGYHIMNSHIYFASDTRLQFLQGIHQLKSDWIVQDVKNFTVQTSRKLNACCVLHAVEMRVTRS